MAPSGLLMNNGVYRNDPICTSTNIYARSATQDFNHHHDVGEHDKKNRVQCPGWQEEHQSHRSSSAFSRQDFLEKAE